MNWIETFEAFNEVLEQEKSFLLFVKVDGCSVCDGLYPQIADIQETFDVPFYAVNASHAPEIQGQLSLFSAPVILLFREGKEYARFARFIRMEKLKGRLAELVEWGEKVD